MAGLQTGEMLGVSFSGLSLFSVGSLIDSHMYSLKTTRTYDLTVL